MVVRMKRGVYMDKMAEYRGGRKMWIVSACTCWPVAAQSGLSRGHLPRLQWPLAGARVRCIHRPSPKRVIFFAQILSSDLHVTGRIMTRSNKSSHHKPDHREGTQRKDKDAASKQIRPESPRGCHSSLLGFRHLVLGGYVLLIFVYTAMPSVPGGDAGELLASGCQFAIPHPPGYPLLNVFYYLTGSTPFPSIPPPLGCASCSPSTVALASNMLSGVFGSVTAVFACLAIEEWTHGLKGAYNPGAAAAGALLFCLSPLAWEYSTGSEVFALNNMLVAAVLYLTARIVRRPSLNFARAGALVCGFALSNQHASALVLVPLALPVMRVLSKESLLSWKFMAELGGLWFMLGLSPYATLVIPAQVPQQGSWGDLSSLQGFVRHVFRVEYGTLRLGVVSSPSGEGVLERVWEYLKDCSTQTRHLGPPLSLLGVAWALLVGRRVADPTTEKGQAVRRARVYGGALVAAWVFYVGFWHGVISNISLWRPMSRAVHARFWMQPNLLVCIAAGGGIGVVVNFITARCLRGRLSSSRIGKRFIAVAIAAMTLALPVVLMTVLVHLQWDVMYNRGAWSDRSDGWTMHLYGQALLSTLPKNAILLSHTDLDLNAARYLRVCEGFRTDVTHISLQMMPYPWWNTVQAKLHPGVVFPPILRGVSTKRDSMGNAVLITRFLAANLHLGRPIFLDMQAVNEREIGTVGAYRGFTLMPHGLTFRVLPKLTLEGTERWHQQIVRQMRSLDEVMLPVSTNTYHPGSWEFAAISVRWDAHYQAGLFFLSYAIGVSVEPPEREQRPHFLPALRDASTILQYTLQEVDSSGAFSSSRALLLKNTILAKVRLLQGLQAAALVASKANEERSVTELSLSPLDKLYAEVRSTKEQCLTLIPRFMLEEGDDKDAETFGKVYIKLRAG